MTVATTPASPARAAKLLVPPGRVTNREEHAVALALLASAPIPDADRRFPRPQPGHKWRDVPMPPGVAKLPRDRARGYPIFYTIDVPGRPDGFFQAQDPQKIARCHSERRCNVCGGRLVATSWFVGGPQSTAAGQYIEPPLHQECLAYALQVCPFLLHKRVEYRDTPAGLRLIPTHTDGPRVDTFYLVRAAGWDFAIQNRLPTFFLTDRREVIRWTSPL